MYDLVGKRVPLRGTKEVGYRVGRVDELLGRLLPRRIEIGVDVPDGNYELVETILLG